MKALPVERHAPATPITGPSVLLIHGFASSGAAEWPDHRWAQPLGNAGRETLVVDLPAHGAGPAVPSAEDATPELVLEQLSEAVLTASTERIDVVAYSLGARLAWDLAAVSPIPVRRLVLGGLSPGEPFAAIDLDAARALLGGASPRADPVTTAIAGLIARSGYEHESLLNLVQGLARGPFEPARRPPSVPTLLVAGRADAMADGIEELAATAPYGRIARVPGDHGEALHSAEFVTRAFEFLELAGATGPTITNPALQ